MYVLTVTGLIIICYYYCLLSRVHRYRHKCRRYRVEEHQLNSCGNSECSDDEENQIDSVMSYNSHDMVKIKRKGGKNELRVGAVKGRMKCGYNIMLEPFQFP